MLHNALCVIKWQMCLHGIAYISPFAAATALLALDRPQGIRVESGRLLNECGISVF